MALATASTSAAAVSIRAYDFGWHLRAGNWILEHGRPPLVDFITFTASGQPWVDHEWLFQVLLAALVAAGGLPAAWGLKILLVAGSILLPCGVLLRRGHHPAAVALLGVVAVSGARFRFFVRPELAGLFLLAVILTLLMQARDASRSGRSPWPLLVPLPVIMLLWVNLHPSALLGAGLSLIFSVAVLAESRDIDRAWPFLATAGASLATLLANPYGARVFHVPLAIGTALAGEGLRNPEWGPSWQPTFWFFWLLLPLLTAAALLAWRRGAHLAIPMLFCGIALALLGATSLRFLGFFYIGIPLVVLGSVDRNPGGGGELPGTERVLPGVLSWAGLIMPLAAAAWFLVSPWGAPLGAGLAPGRFPEAMAERYRSLGLDGAVYHPVRFGGYLAWVLDPQPVFIDGRNEVHAGLLMEMAGYRQRGDLAGWGGMLGRWNIQAAILSYEDALLTVRLPDGSFVERSPRAVFFRREKWALVDWDDTAMLLLRRDLLDRLPDGVIEDTVSAPDDPGRLAARLADGAIDPGEVLAMARRRQKGETPGLRARLMEQLALEQMIRNGTSVSRGEGRALDTGSETAAGQN
jgi:hypothetical protein